MPNCEFCNEKMIFAGEAQGFHKDTGEYRHIKIYSCVGCGNIIKIDQIGRGEKKNE